MGSTSAGAATGLPAVSAAERRRLLTVILKDVSRAFYLSVRALPGGMREPVGLAYLLARAADTIADTALLPPEDRLRLLLLFRAQLDGPPSSESLAEIESALLIPSEWHDSQPERALLRALPQAFAMLDSLPDADAEKARQVVTTLTRGMEMDLATFPPEDSGHVAALPSVEDLDRYIYLVAGCVGEFWTDIMMAHTPSLRGWDRERMAALGVRFGKALQLTNILRDVPKDLRTGRCYLPRDVLARAGLAPPDLLDQANAEAARPALHAGIDMALERFAAAEEYVLAIPRRNLRLRLAALWPLLLGLATLAETARKDAWLDPARPSKVRRRRVYAMIALSFLSARSNTILRAWITAARNSVIFYENKPRSAVLD